METPIQNQTDDTQEAVKATNSAKLLENELSPEELVYYQEFTAFKVPKPRGTHGALIGSTEVALLPENLSLWYESDMDEANEAIKRSWLIEKESPDERRLLARHYAKFRAEGSTPRTFRSISPHKRPAEDHDLPIAA